MSRVFDGTPADNFLTITGEALLSWTLGWTVACWAKPNRLGSNEALISAADSTFPDRRNYLGFANTDVGRGIAVRTTTEEILDSAAQATGVWVPLVFRVSDGGTSLVITSANWAERNTGTITLDWATGTLANFVFGVNGQHDSTPSTFYDGKVAHVVVWPVELSDVDIQSFIAGDDPAGINTANQNAYWPMTDTSLTDIRNSLVLSITGSVPFDADNPPVGSAPTKTASVRLADLNGNDRANVASVPWAWYDSLPQTGVGPTDTGTGSTDANGNMTVTLNNTTLNAGGVGYLLTDTGPWQAIHAVTVVES